MCFSARAFCKAEPEKEVEDGLFSSVHFITVGKHGLSHTFKATARLNVILLYCECDLKKCSHDVPYLKCHYVFCGTWNLLGIPGCIQWIWGRLTGRSCFSRSPSSKVEWKLNPPPPPSAYIYIFFFFLYELCHQQCDSGNRLETELLFWKSLVWHQSGRILTCSSSSFTPLANVHRLNIDLKRLRQKHVQAEYISASCSLNALNSPAETLH